MGSNRGGQRPGSGAKLKYKEPTAVLTIRVPASKLITIKNLIKKLLKKYE